MKSEETFYDIVDRTGGYPVHAVHRGGGGIFGPENTLYSYEKSLQYGARLLEIDIRLTRDKELIIMHDSSVERTTDGSGPVNQYTLEELKTLDAAHYYPELKGSDIRVPTLMEFLTLFVPVSDLLFMFDFKDKESILEAMKMIDSFNIGNRYILCSVFEDSNQLLREIRHSPSVPVVTDIESTFKLTIAHNTGLWFFLPDSNGQNIYGYVLLPSTRPLFTKSLIKNLHKRNLQILVCGDEVSKEECMQECIENGVDYIMTDRPDLLEKILALRKEIY